jgi:hypothetical protein
MPYKKMSRKQTIRIVWLLNLVFQFDVFRIFYHNHDQGGEIMIGLVFLLTIVLGRLYRPFNDENPN